MLSKKAFVNAINAIIKQENINKSVGKSLESVCDSYVVFGKSEILPELLNVLKEAVNDKYDNIEWWLYDAPEDGRYIYYNDTITKEKIKIDVSTPEKLYDYIKDVNKELEGNIL